MDLKFHFVLEYNESETIFKHMASFRSRGRFLASSSSRKSSSLNISPLLSKLFVIVEVNKLNAYVSCVLGPRQDSIQKFNWTIEFGEL